MFTPAKVVVISLCRRPASSGRNPMSAAAKPGWSCRAARRRPPGGASVRPVRASAATAPATVCSPVGSTLPGSGRYRAAQ